MAAKERENSIVVSPSSQLPIDLRSSLDSSIRRVDSVMDMADFISPDTYSTFPGVDGICEHIPDLSAPPRAPVMKSRSGGGDKSSRPRPGRTYSGGKAT